MDAMPDKVTAKILENCLIDGAVPLTTEDMQDIFGDGDTLGTHYWAKPPRTDVGMHPIPQDFIFPK